MKVRAGSQPAASFLIEAKGDGICEIRFYDNVHQVTVQDETGGTARTEWEYDEYVMSMFPYRDKLADDIAANYAAWLTTAKQEELYRQPADYVAMRADIDFIMAMEGLSD